MTGQTLGSPSTAAFAAVKRAANQTGVLNNTFTPITFDTLVEDSLGTQFDLAGNPTRLTCKQPGVYSIRASAAFAGNGTGTRTVYIRVNGTVYYGSSAYVPHATNIVKFSTMDHIRLALNDYVESVVYEDSGATLSLTAGEDSLGLSFVKVMD
jgi:hypothetical protein